MISASAPPESAHVLPGLEQLPSVPGHRLRLVWRVSICVLAMQLIGMFALSAPSITGST